MPDEIIKISELPDSSALDGSEIVPIVKDGVTSQTTTQEIADLSSGGDFASLTGSPYDNTTLGNVLNSKQDRLKGIVSGCEITVETFVGAGTNKRIRVGDGTWYITPSEYTKATDTVSDEITLCETGGDFKYYDIVADDSGAITIYEGTPSTAPAHYVINPLTEVLLGFITVGDAVIEEPIVIPTTVLETFFESIYVSSGVATLDCQEKAFPRFLISSLDSSPLELVINNTFGVVEISVVLDIPAPNSNKGLITLPTFCYPATYQISDNARYYSVKMTKYLGLLFCDFQPLSEVSLKQNINQVKSASFVAQNDNNYVTNATATVTDPAPVNGKGYSVIVVAGTTTIDSVAYSTAGTKITRIYDGAAWVTTTGSGTITDLSGIPASTATANTLAFFDADKELVSAPSLSSLGIAETTYVDTQDKKFKLDIEFQSAAFLYTYYFEDAATLTLVRKESTISVVEYSTNGGGAYTTISSMGVISLAMPSATYVIFRITYVTPSLASRGNLYFEGTY